MKLNNNNNDINDNRLGFKRVYIFISKDRGAEDCFLGNKHTEMFELQQRDEHATSRRAPGAHGMLREGL